MKQNKAKIRSFNFALIGSKKKRKKEKKFCMSVRNACESDLVSLRFALRIALSATGTAPGLVIAIDWHVC